MKDDVQPWFGACFGRLLTNDLQAKAETLTRSSHAWGSRLPGSLGGESCYVSSVLLHNPAVKMNTTKRACPWLDGRVRGLGRETGLGQAQVPGAVAMGSAIARIHSLFKRGLAKV